MSRPRVVVLLATFDGAAHLDEQLDSILGQTGVDVRVVVSDDGSTDGTLDLLARPRVAVLPVLAPSGSAAANFRRLLRDADVDPDEYVSLADQDDVWHPDKLARHVAVLAAGEVDGVSSDVVAVHADGTRHLLGKAEPQRLWDWVCESAGPGSTFVLSPRLAALVREVVAAQEVPVDLPHDWLVYAICRARGWSWHIDPAPSLDYRQHDDNALGANLGRDAARRRLAQVRAGWYTRQARAVLAVARTVAPDPAAIGRVDALLAATPRRRLARLRLVPQLRRRRRERLALAAMVLAGWW